MIKQFQIMLIAVLKYPKLSYSIIIALTVALMLQLPSMQIDTDPENMLGESNAFRTYHNQVKQQFSLHDSIVLGVVNRQGIYNPQSLAIIAKVTDYVLSLEGVIAQDVIAPSVVDNIEHQADGVISFSWLMKKPPTTIEQSQKIAKAIARLPLLNNTMVSSDNLAIAVYIPLKTKTISYEIAQKIRNYVEQFDSSHQFYITGLPVAEDQFGQEMFVQMAISAPLAGAMIFMMMWLFFRNFALIVAPMLVAIATVLITMGLLVTLGFKVHILSSMIAIFLMPIAVVDSIHIISEFVDRYQHQRDQPESADVVIKKVVAHLFKPMLFTSITSAVGFFSLLLTPIPPVKVFGAFVGFGILLAFVLTMIIVPIYISRLSAKSLAKIPNRSDVKSAKLDQLLAVINKFSNRRPRVILLLVLAIAVFSLVGISKIVINDNPIRWFKQSHQISVADRVLNSHFSGTYNAYLVFSTTDTAQQQLKFFDYLADLKKTAKLYDIQLTPISSSEQLSQHIDAWLISLDDLLFEQSDSLTDQQVEFIQFKISQLNTFASTLEVFYQPQLLQYLDKIQDLLELSPQVGKVNSLSDLIKTVNRELKSGNSSDFELPTTANGVSQVLMQYQSSHRPNDLWHFVTPDKQASLMWLQLKSGDNTEMSLVIDLVEQYLVANPPPHNIQVQWAGKAFINVIWQQEMVAGMLKSLTGAYIMVFLMMVILFRSVGYGLLAMLPLSITIALIYGLIGWIGKDYDMPIAVLSSLTLGLSVDFAIHFIERLRQLLKTGDPLPMVLNQMFDQPARAISRNAIVIAMGFTPLLLAPLVPYITVGIFLASIMIISALITLLLLPAIMTLVLSHNIPTTNLSTLEIIDETTI